MNDDEGLVVTRPLRRRRRISVSSSRSRSPISPSSSARPSRSPRTPPSSQGRRRPSPRRVSFGPTDVFMSPVEWSKQPSFDRDADVVSRILSHGTTMCREEITPFYIQSAVRDPNMAVWLVRDANERVFGFALTKQHSSYIELKLICTHRRKGEGTKMFDEILEYSRVMKQDIQLEAVNSKVALLYARAAHKAGHQVYLGDAQQTLSHDALQDEIVRMDRMIPMRISPSGDRSFSTSHRN